MEPIIKVYASQDYVGNNTVLYSEAQDLTEEQKLQAMNNLGVFTQGTEPEDAEIGTWWIDTSEEDGSDGGASVALDTTLTLAGYAADAKAVGDAIENHTHTPFEVGIPSPTTTDSGKFLRVNSSGIFALETVAIAEEASF